VRLATLRVEGHEQACLQTPSGFLPLELINQRLGTGWPTELLPLIAANQLDGLREWAASFSRDLEKLGSVSLSGDAVVFAPLYRRPRKIWGIGLNYREHAADLDEKTPTSEPASFLKPDSTIIGSGDTILIPHQSERTTAEAELGLIFGKRCKNVRRGDWLGALAGFTTIIDMTAEDILRRNPRNLTQAKSFDTFFSFGPVLVTPEEVEDLSSLKVRTRTNGKLHAENAISNMTFPPDLLVEYHTAIWTAYPGDVISTGTPGAVPISEGDVVECQIDDFTTLSNPVHDLKG
jgi:2-keto-4-pentenoate hydratase/2-oxohepta-3-ene-1,7-dioic acid hydratase in catechol pathway